MAFHWHADDGPTLNGSFVSFQGIRTSIAKKPSGSAHVVLIATTVYYSLNMYVQLSSGARCLNFELHIINVLLCVCKQLKLLGDSASGDKNTSQSFLSSQH